MNKEQKIAKIKEIADKKGLTALHNLYTDRILIESGFGTLHSCDNKTKELDSMLVFLRGFRMEDYFVR